MNTMQRTPINLRSFACVALSLICLGGVSSVRAQTTPTYGYNPMSRYYLGAGLSLNDPSEGKDSPFKMPVAQTSLPTGPRTTTLTATVARSVRALKEALGLDFNLDASYLSYSGSVRLAYEQTNNLRTEDVCVVITATVDWGNIRLNKPVATPEALELLKADKDAFEARYGSHYISQMTMGTSVSCILTFNNVDQDTRNEFNATLTGKGAAGWGQISTSASLKSLAAFASKNSSLSFRLLTVGGGGLSELTNFVTAIVQTSSDPIKEIGDRLAEYVKGFNNTSSAPIRHYTLPTSLLGITPPNFFNDTRNKRLIETVEKYRELQGIIDDIDNTLNDTASETVPLTTLMRSNLTKQRNLNVVYQNLLADFHLLLKKTKTLASVPALPAAPSGWRSLEKMHLTSDYFPRPLVTSFINVPSAGTDYRSNPVNNFTFGGLNANTGRFEPWYAYDLQRSDLNMHWGVKRDSTPNSKFVASDGYEEDGAYMKSAPANDNLEQPIVRWTSPASGWWKISCTIRGPKADYRGSSELHFFLNGVDLATRNDTNLLVTPAGYQFPNTKALFLYVPSGYALEFRLIPRKSEDGSGRYYEHAAWVRTEITWDH